jgi:hypothetical protein
MFVAGLHWSDFDWLADLAWPAPPVTSIATPVVIAIPALALVSSRLGCWFASRLACFLPAAPVPDFVRRLVARRRSGPLNFVGVFLVFELYKVCYIKEGVALKSKVDKCRLHAGQNARNASVIYRARKRVLVFAFVVDFRELIVFKNCKPRFMRRA